jgi:hypothetical protein
MGAGHRRNEGARLGPTGHRPSPGQGAAVLDRSRKSKGSSSVAIATGQGEAPEAFRLTQLRQSFESFGVLVDFLSRIDPFSAYDIGNFSRALQFQLSRRCHVAAVEGNRLVGYVGWMPTTRAIAEAWSQDRGPLTPVADPADAVALTVVATLGDKRVLAALIRRAREANPGLPVYFKRQYAGGRRAARKSHVRNVQSG